MAKNGMTREEAKVLYENLHKSMTKWMANKEAKGQSSKQKVDPKKIAESIRQGLRGDSQEFSNNQNYNSNINSSINGSAISLALPPLKTMDRGQAICLILIISFAMIKVFFSALEAVGFATATKVSADVPSIEAQIKESGNFTREDKKVLTSLDARRAELSERGKKMDLREIDLEARENELEIKLAELRQLTSKLKTNREGVDQKRNLQVEQLAKIYSSMSPEESARLMEDLDVSIALELMQKMSEKRIGQILSLMDQEKALKMSKMLVTH
ncbi:MAG: MotE family protein [Bdellovibrionota bacterium]